MHLRIRAPLSTNPYHPRALQLLSQTHMCYSLNSLKGGYIGGYIGEYIGDYYRAY